MKKTCRTRTLAANGAGRIHHCAGCNSFTIDLGAITVRVDEAVAEGLWALLGESLQKVHREKTEPLLNTPVRGSA